MDKLLLITALGVSSVIGVAISIVSAKYSPNMTDKFTRSFWSFHGWFFYLFNFISGYVIFNEKELTGKYVFILLCVLIVIEALELYYLHFKYGIIATKNRLETRIKGATKDYFDLSPKPICLKRYDVKKGYFMPFFTNKAFDEKLNLDTAAFFQKGDAIFGDELFELFKSQDETARKMNGGLLRIESEYPIGHKGYIEQDVWDKYMISEDVLVIEGAF